MQFLLILNTFYNMYFYLISTSLSKILDKRFIAFFIWVFIHSTRTILVNNHCTNFYREVKLYILSKKEDLSNGYAYNIKIL